LDTIGYEVVSRIGQRVPRLYLDRGVLLDGNGRPAGSERA
jgi:hypothetical protein